jgi:hypothetical protein
VVARNGGNPLGARERDFRRAGYAAGRRDQTTGEERDPMVTNADVLRFLESMDFPADKEAIVRAAEREGAPPKVLRALRALPPVDYQNRNEVVRSAGTDIAPETSPAEQAARARDKKHQRVARHLRGI